MVNNCGICGPKCQKVIKYWGTQTQGNRGSPASMLIVVNQVDLDLKIGPEWSKEPIYMHIIWLRWSFAGYIAQRLGLL
jgi:hypothetical protein